MTTSPASSNSPADQQPSQPVYAESELYDSPAELAKWPELAPLLKSWHTEVWEKDHKESSGCWYYDQEAIRLQERHKVAVFVAAAAGTTAVVLAILQLPFGKVETNSLLNLEVICLIAAAITVLLGAIHSLDHRWREHRFKAEQYRKLKFRFLPDAARWLAASEEERAEHLSKYISGIHGANRDVIKEWIHWKKEILPVLETPEAKLDANLAGELVDYFRQKRLVPQRRYFHDRGHQLHRTESIVRYVGPGLFFASVICALTHAAIHIMGKSHATAVAEKTSHELGKEAAKIGGEISSDASTKAKQPDDKKDPDWAIVLALGAAIIPVFAAGIRTIRGAFEFGRNSLRFESMAHHLELLLDELDKAKSPEAKLAILRRGEHAMEGEHRAWMRLMMEAEWFG